MVNFKQSLKVNGTESIAEFYAGKSVFITGGAGFLGKALIEKLLYSCEDIDKIFILIRDKTGVSEEKRLLQIFSNPIFLRIISERPQDVKKIIPIKGDITELDLGISPSDQATLLKKVSVVFHIAATIKLQEDLKIAVNTNVIGTKNVLDFCHRINNIEAFVHVSTAYCYPDQTILEEKVYSPKADLEKVFEYVNQPTKDSNLENDFLKGFPSTYTFTKNLAESYVAKHCGNLPTIIIRPSIVCAAFCEPLVGWTDNWHGATGLTMASIKGINRVIYGDGNNILDLIPVDYVSNATIVAPTKCSSSKSLTVYNCCTSSCNPISCKKLFDGVRRSAIETGFGHSNQELFFTKNKCLFFIITLFLQIIPAYIADLYRWVIGKKPMYVNLQRRVLKGRTLLNLYTSNHWEMKADNVKAMHSSLSYSDKNTFPCDPSLINWDQYAAAFLSGVKKYLMKEM